MHLAKNLALLGLFVVVGVLAGIGGKQLYQEWNQPRPIEHRDYASVLNAHDAEVLLFSTATCPYCKKARASLAELGIGYRELDIDASPDADAAFKALGERGVPVLVTRDRLIRGFQPEAYRELAQADDATERGGRKALPQASSRSAL